MKRIVMKRIVNAVFWLAVVVLIGLAAPELPGFDEGLAAYNRSDYGTAMGAWWYWLCGVVGGVLVICWLIVLFQEVPWWKPFAYIGLLVALGLYLVQCAGSRGIRYSGGPVLDRSGHVVGVVVARLDALKLAERTGRLPQNVNFAISEGTARAFLDANNVPYEVEPSDKPLPSADIAAKARDFTVRVECWK